MLSCSPDRLPCACVLMCLFSIITWTHSACFSTVPAFITTIIFHVPLMHVFYDQGYNDLNAYFLFVFNCQHCVAWLTFYLSLCSRRIQLSLTILLLGVGIATVTDLQLNILGSILSLLAVLTTCVAQIVSFNNTFYWSFLFHPFCCLNWILQ